MSQFLRSRSVLPPFPFVVLTAALYLTLPLEVLSQAPPGGGGLILPEESNPDPPKVSEVPIISKVYEVSGYTQQEIEEMIKPLMSDRGKIVVLADTGKALVQDEAVRLEIIDAVMKELAKPRPNIRVEVAFNETSRSNSGEASARWNAGNDRVTVTNDPRVKRNSIDVTINSRTTTSSRNAGQFLVTQSGRAATLRVVREVPVVFFRQYLYGLNRALVRQDVVWKDVGSRLSILPRVQGNLITVEVTPQFSVLTDTGRQTIDVRELTTTLTVAPGQWIHMGGFNGASDQFNSYFFGGVSSNRTGNNSGFRMRASVMGAGSIDPYAKDPFKNFPSR